MENKVRVLSPPMTQKNISESHYHLSSLPIVLAQGYNNSYFNKQKNYDMQFLPVLVSGSEEGIKQVIFFFLKKKVPNKLPVY